MLTKNFKALLQMACLSVGSRLKGFIQAKNVTGADVYLSRISTSGGWPGTFPPYVHIENSNNIGIYVGSGNTPASENDYCLENKITQGLKGSLTIDTTDQNLDENGVLQNYILITLTNTSNETITISEIGMVTKAYAATNFNASSANEHSFLLDRTVLTTPLTLAPNESGLISYVFKLDS